MNDAARFTPSFSMAAFESQKAKTEHPIPRYSTAIRNARSRNGRATSVPTFPSWSASSNASAVNSTAPDICMAYASSALV